MRTSSIPFSCVPCPSQCCLSQFSHRIFHSNIEGEGRGISVPTIMSGTVGALLDKEGVATKDIQQRLSKARQTVYRLQRIWDCNEISRKTKVQLFKTIVRAVLMYGCEAWKLTKTEGKKLDAFQYKCMKRILRIRWPRTISHQQIQETTGVNRTSDEIRRRRWNWIGHILRKNREEHCVTALEWWPEGKNNMEENG